MCLFALLEKFFQFNPLAGFFGVEDDLFRGGLLRVRATLYHPIALGCFIALVFPFVLSALIREPRGRKKTALGVLLAAMLITSILTVSRGPWIAILLESSIFVAWWAWRNMRRVAMIGFALVFVATAFALLRTNDAFDQKVAPILNPDQFSLERTNEASSEYYRIALLKAVIDRLEGPRWIYGFGRGTFYLADVESNYDNTDHVLGAGDSHYVLLLLETGIAGLSAFLLLLFAALGTCARRALKADGHYRLIALAGCAAAAGFILNNITVSMFPVLPLSLVFWLSIAVAYTSSQHIRPGISKEL